MTDLLFFAALSVFFVVGRPRWLFRWMGLLMVLYVLVFVARDVLAGSFAFVLFDLVILAFVLFTIEVDRQRAIRKKTVAAYRRFFYGEEPE